MTTHFILPATMVKPLFLHMFHRSCLDSDVRLWIYGTEDVHNELDNYQSLHDILSELMEDEIVKGICDTRTVNVEGRLMSDSPGMSDLILRARLLVENNFIGEVESNDEVTIIAVNQLWLGVASVFRFMNLTNKAPRIITTLDITDAASVENLNTIYRQYEGNIRIDIVGQGKCLDILTVARAVEAIEPPNEPNGIYLTKQPLTSLYITENDLPTPVTVISIHTVRQLAHNLRDAENNAKFLKKTSTERSFSSLPELKKLKSALKAVEDYLVDMSSDFRSDFRPVDMSRQLMDISMLPNGHSRMFYCRAALKHVLSYSFANMEEVDEGAGATPLQLPDVDWLNIDFKDCLNPFLAVEVTRTAFTEWQNKKWEGIRSACLDLWEIFMTENHPSSIRIEEVKNETKDYQWEMLKFFPQSKSMSEQKVEFKIYESEKIIGITSPYTGFAVSHPLSGSIVELADRSVAFKCFIYDYVMSVKEFSVEFQEYISSNCKTEEVSADSRDLFEKYPHLGKQMPIY